MMGKERSVTDCLDGVNGGQKNRISKRKNGKLVAYLLLNDLALMLNF